MKTQPAELYTEISTWLSDPNADYWAGVKLYEKYGPDIRLKLRVFPAGDFLGNKKTLRYELEKLVKKKSLLHSRSVKPVSTSPDQPGKEVSEKVSIPKTNDGYLRKEFPQLKFSDLPDDLKVLVVDKIALYHKANELREKKFDAATDQERLDLNAGEIEARMENKLIWDELNHFQQTGKVLGKHPRFARQKEIEKLALLTREQLFKKKQNFPSSISKAKKAIKDNPGDEQLIIKKQLLLEKYQWQQREVDRLLGL
jgi:hypothetical protein